MTPVWKRLTASTVIVVALVVAAVATLAATDRLPGTEPEVPAVRHTADPGPRMESHGPKPPRGVWMGAWVKPTGPETQQSLVSTFVEYEKSVGRRLDLPHLYRPWESPFPRGAEFTFLRHGYQVLVSWGGTDTRSIVAGQYDDLIRARARAVKRLDKPIMLMWRGEMDRPNLQAEIWSPADYIAAWRHIRTIFDEEGARNIGWVWCPTAKGFTEGRAQAYYPGDNQVDWLCADVYPEEGDDPPFSEVSAAFLKWAKGHDKPIVIGEYGADRRDAHAQAAWIRGAWRTIKAHPQIHAATYFDEDDVDKNGHLYKYSVRGNPAALSAFGRVLADPYFNPNHLIARRK